MIFIFMIFINEGHILIFMIFMIVIFMIFINEIIFILEVKALNINYAQINSSP